jgi:hypothetical protein
VPDSIVNFCEIAKKKWKLTRAIEVEAVRGCHLDNGFKVVRFAGRSAPLGTEIGGLIYFVICRFIAEGTNRVGFHSIDAGGDADEVFGYICMVWGSPDDTLPCVDFAKLSSCQAEGNL